MPRDNRGFAPVLLIIAVTVVMASVFIVKNLTSKNTPLQPPSSIEPNKSIATPSASISPTSNIKISKTSTITPPLSASLVPSPTSTSTSNNSCSYDLSGPTGAIQVNIKPKSNQVVGDQTVELQATLGCKVLDGRSTDKQTMIAKAGGNGYSSQNSVTYSTVPAGPYSVRIQYKDQWTNYINVDAVSIQSKTVEFFVDGEIPPSTPTPTPQPKPVCTVLVEPSNTGTAPYQASICVGNNSNPPQSIQQELVDYDGDGTWDYQGPQYGCHGYIFQTPGTYTPKAKYINTSGVESDICQATAIIN